METGERLVDALDFVSGVECLISRFDFFAPKNTRSSSSSVIPVGNIKCLAGLLAAVPLALEEVWGLALSLGASAVTTVEAWSFLSWSGDLLLTSGFLASCCACDSCASFWCVCCCPSFFL